MQFHSASDRSVGYLFLMRARVAKYPPRTTFHTVSDGKFSEVRCYPIFSRRPSLVRFNSCAPTSPTIISGEVGSADDRVIPTQSSANLFDFSAPARCSKMLIEVSVPLPLSSA